MSDTRAAAFQRLILGLGLRGEDGGWVCARGGLRWEGSGFLIWGSSGYKGLEAEGAWRGQAVDRVPRRGRG